jgi:peptide/nickel transport system ATP-binding protein
MLDVSIRMGVLNLLAQLKQERQLAILLITHDLASARYLAERILVLFQGRVVEDGPTAALVASPAHPYTRTLLAAIASADDIEATPEAPKQNDREAPVEGCPFAPRCTDVHDICRTNDPSPRTVDDRRVRCHLYPEADAR